MSNLENTIKGYLDKRAEEDSLFAESYKKPGKSIKECCDYIVGQAYKQGGSTVVVDDDTVYGWAVHYYDEDGIKVDKLPARAGVRPVVELSDEEKARAREDAIERYKLECIAKEKAAEAEKKKRAWKKRKREGRLKRPPGLMYQLYFLLTSYETENETGEKNRGVKQQDTRD